MPRPEDIDPSCLITKEIDDVLQKAITWEQNQCEGHAKELEKAVQAYLKTRSKGGTLAA
jgi:predicted nucleic acid-binding Zn ribbon protein